MAILDKISETFGKYAATVIGIALLTVTVILTINVVGRYCFGQSLTFGEELATYVIIWVTFVGSGVCVQRGIHVSVDAFINFLPPTAKKGMDLFGLVVGLAFSAILCYAGLILCSQVVASGQISPAMRMPMVIAYAALPVGTLYMILEYIRKILEMFIGGGDTDDEDDVEKLIEKGM